MGEPSAPGDYSLPVISPHGQFVLLGIPEIGSTHKSSAISVNMGSKRWRIATELGTIRSEVRSPG